MTWPVQLDDLRDWLGGRWNTSFACIKTQPTSSLPSQPHHNTPVVHSTLGRSATSKYKSKQTKMPPRAALALLAAVTLSGVSTAQSITTTAGPSMKSSSTSLRLAKKYTGRDFFTAFGEPHTLHKLLWYSPKKIS